jgi:hypothetical protein
MGMSVPDSPYTWYLSLSSVPEYGNASPLFSKTQQFVPPCPGTWV